MSEDDDESRGEALLGLARRRDPNALALVRDELNRPFAATGQLKRRSFWRGSSLYPALQAVWESFLAGGQDAFQAKFDAALDACKPTENPTAGEVDAV